MSDTNTGITAPDVLPRINLLAEENAKLRADLEIVQKQLEDECTIHTEIMRVTQADLEAARSSNDSKMRQINLLQEEIKALRLTNRLLERQWEDVKDALESVKDKP